MRRTNSSSGVGNSKVNFSNRLVPAPKKVEGFDLRATLSPQSRPEPINPNYRTTIESIKNKSKVKDLEDEYINGLQDQVKFLEYQLKLLKDKELQQHSTAEQLGKFFDDGVPLNENIMAMKNCFTNQKTQFESKCKNLKVECKQKMEFISNVRIQIERIKNVCKKTDSEKIVREDLLVGQIAEMTKKMKQYIHQSKLAEDANRDLQVRHHKLEEELATMKLNSEIEGILTKEDVRNGQISLIKVQLEEKDNEIGRLESEREALRLKVEESTVANQLELKNAELKKKILSVTKQLNLLNTKVEQAKHECDLRLKERETEAIHKRDIVAKVQQFRKLIDIENKLTEKDLQNKIAEREKAEVRIIERKKQSLMKYLTFKKAETEKLESETQQILSGKAELQQKLTELSNDVDRLNAKVHTQRDKQIELVSSIESLEASRKILDTLKEPLPELSIKMTKRLQNLQSAIQKLQRDNTLKQKQLQLIKQLKTFNLQQLKLIKNTSNNVQESIAAFLKKWDSIKIEDV